MKAHIESVVWHRRILLFVWIVLLLVVPGLVQADSTPAAQEPNSIAGVFPSECKIASFAATMENDQVVVRWETEVEQYVKGFNLYRAPHDTGTFVKVNADLVPSKVEQGPGSAGYQFLDASVVSGQSYDYWLESIDFQALPTYQGTTTIKVVPGRSPQPANHHIFLPFVTN